MLLSPGTRLGSYEVISSLGSGGMGEVYRARDTKLGRDVALKVLPEAFAVDRDRVARFRREAEVLASLNHPHIAQIYGFEDSGSIHALVLELVDGATLADRIVRGPIALSDALPIAIQIADALEAAHEQGIIHRDLKPANVKVRNDGTVKVLDFGLAKALSSEGANTSPDASSTMTSPAMTELGLILGTAAYMSPEQAKGRAVDKRADIWAFGVVLYEILSGRPLFSGDSVAETIGLVVTREPDWTKLPATTPASVRRLLARCLTRDPKQRLRDIGEARVALGAGGENDGAPPVVAATPASRRKQTLLVAAIAVAGLIAGSAATWTFRQADDAAVSPAAHLSINLQQGMHVGVPQPSLAFSPDGTRLVYSGSSESGIGLWVRPLDRLESTFLSGSTGRNAFFSPDGNWIASINFGKVNKMPIGAGAPVPICDMGTLGIWGGTWTTRNEIVIAVPDQGLFRVAAAGGKPQRVVEGRFWYPDALPDGRHVVVTAENPTAQSSDDHRIVLVNLETGVVTPLLAGGTYVRYAASRHLVYLRQRSLMAVAFDPSTLEVRGAPVAMVQDVYMNPAIPSGNFAISSSGALAYAPSTGAFERTLVAISADGTKRTISDDRRPYRPAVRVSPDGTRLLVTTQAIRGKAWAVALPGGVVTGLTRDESNVASAIWKDDRQVTIALSDNNQPPNIFLVGVNEAGSGGRRGLFPRPGPAAAGAGAGADAVAGLDRLTTSPNEQAPFSWTPDGKTLVFGEQARPAGFDLWMVSMEGDRTPRPLLQTPFHEQAAAIAPDGKRIAFESNRDGAMAVYVADFPSMANIRRVSAGAGGAPIWSRDGLRLLYRGVGGESRGRGRRGSGVGEVIMAVAFGPPPRSTVSDPQRVASVEGATTFDILPDGSVAIVEGNQFAGNTRELNVVLNWFTELRKRVPGR